MTNFESIKNMTVEELANTLYYANDKICFENCNKITGNKYTCPIGEKAEPENCKDCMKRWLESEVDTE